MRAFSSLQSLAPAGVESVPARKLGKSSGALALYARIRLLHLCIFPIYCVTSQQAVNKFNVSAL